MATNAVDEFNAGISDILRSKPIKGSAGEIDRNVPSAPMPVTQGTAVQNTAPQGASDTTARLPRRIAGGFQGVGDDLDRRARDWRNTVRLLEQQRPQLESAETEHARLHEALARIVPEVQENGRALKALLDTTKTGDISGDLATQFNKNLNSLDELESVAEALTANLVWVRSTWEQYARTIIKAQRMREDLKQGAAEH
ncbi:hypothetical protein VSX64_04065 [Aurantimonas sp. C2-6-R+9]|uniref:hypothetical protein n=1 Tax=unclassified Aurantimonas TaxID=2638230 RepID=UPI002E19F0D4|nr:MULTISPECIES: hypothetical protein [unclassified Aurantimonas]MEC5289303.1 hypothetical protein [Aurantimonas sp. C2-3-R2]MEC5380061.1 hypothetical protein [Aurantimonas sp. C2-6-R+9]MEC5410247.1 hypothetical protein [Aurantimonas sp. C2-4-R8]